MNQEYKKWMVRVSCMTYNHAPYIIDALNGFTMQETTFPFVCTIIDDASTDGEPEVIKKYLQDYFALEDESVVRNEETEGYVLTFAQHKTNKNCYFAVLWLKYNHYKRPDLKARKQQYIAEWHDNAKYIAMCEGDDYWTDPFKLQKQFDFLENNQDYGLCYTRTCHLRNNIITEEPINDKCDTVSLLYKNPIRTLSIMHRSKLYDEFLSFSKSNNQPSFDYPLFLWFSHYSKIGYIKDITGVYRILDESASHSKNDSKKTISFMELCMKIRKFWLNKINLNVDEFYYRHNVLCYKFSIANGDKENIRHYRNELLLYKENKEIKKRLLVEFVARTNLDVFLSDIYKYLKPLFSRLDRKYANNW